MEITFLGINDMGWKIYEWLCDRNGVDVTALVTKPSQLDLVTQLQPDMIVAVGFDHIVPPKILSVPSDGCLNLHPGYLPDTRGYNPNVWSIVEDHPAGATLHYMEESVDTGDVVARREVEKRFEDNGKDLYERIEDASIELFKESWPEIERGEAETFEQDDTDAVTHVKQDFVDLCEIHPDEQVRTIDLLRRLKALTYPPFDNAYVELDGDRYYLELSITPENDSETYKDTGLLSAYEAD